PPSEDAVAFLLTENRAEPQAKNRKGSFASGSHRWGSQRGVDGFQPALSVTSGCADSHDWAVRLRKNLSDGSFREVGKPARAPASTQHNQVRPLALCKLQNMAQPHCRIPRCIQGCTSHTLPQESTSRAAFPK